MAYKKPVTKLARSSNTEQSLAFYGIICLTLATIVIFLWLLSGIVPDLPKNSSSAKTTMQKGPRNSPVLTDIPTYVTELPVLDVVKGRFLSKMSKIGQCQLQQLCPRRVLQFTSSCSSKKPCDDVGLRLMGLVSAFYLAYATDRLFYVSWPELTELFDVNNVKNYDANLSSRDDLTKNAENWSMVVEELATVEAIILTENNFAFVEEFVKRESFKPSLVELFTVPRNDSRGKPRLLVEANFDNLMGIALRILLNSPSSELKILVNDVWKQMYEIVDPPPGRQLIPGRLVGNDGITRFGIYAPFDGLIALTEQQRYEAQCFCEGATNIMTYYGMVNGIGGTFVASNSEEARTLIGDCIAKRGLPSISIDTAQMVRALGINSQDWQVLNDVRSIVEWTLLTRMDALIYRQSFLGDLAALTALRGNVPAHYLPYILPPFNKTANNYDEFCQFLTKV